MSNSNKDSQELSGSSDNQSQLNQTAEPAVSSGPCGASRTAGNDRGEVELDTALSNTVSNKYRNEIFKPLRWGIDSLYLSFTGVLDGYKESELKTLKCYAQNDSPLIQAQAQIQLSGHIFEVNDKGFGMFPYVLKDNCFRINLSRAQAKSLPMAYVVISSEYLTHKEPKVIVDDLRSVLNELGRPDFMPKVSRIDLFVDFASSFDMESWNRHAWVTRATSINQYSVDQQFSGWTVGAGGVVSARLYDKLLEIISSGKAYLVPLWQSAGWSPETDGGVWRMEFQFKRDILSQFDIQLLTPALSHLDGLWSYATTEWLKLTLPSEADTNRSRWPVHPLWECLASVDFEADGGPLSRKFSPSCVPSDDRLFNHGLSVLTTFMARENVTDFDQGMKQLAKSMYDYFIAPPKMLSRTDFDLFIDNRVGVKRRHFNTLLNKPFSGPSKLNVQAEAYRRAKDGR